MLVSPPIFSAEDSVVDKAQRIKKLQHNIQTLRKTLESDYGQKNKLELSLRSTETSIARHSAALRKLSRQLQRQRNRLEELKQDKQAQQQRLTRHQHALAEQIRASYTMGRQGYIKIILSNQDPARIGRTMTYYKYCKQARAHRINKIDNSIV